MESYDLYKNSSTKGHRSGTKVHSSSSVNKHGNDNKISLELELGGSSQCRLGLNKDKRWERVNQAEVFVSGPQDEQREKFNDRFAQVHQVGDYEPRNSSDEEADEWVLVKSRKGAVARRTRAAAQREKEAAKHVRREMEKELRKTAGPTDYTASKEVENLYRSNYGGLARNYASNFAVYPTRDIDTGKGNRLNHHVDFDAAMTKYDEFGGTPVHVISGTITDSRNVNKRNPAHSHRRHMGELPTESRHSKKVEAREEAHVGRDIATAASGQLNKKKNKNNNNNDDDW